MTNDTGLDREISEPVRRRRRPLAAATLALAFAAGAISFAQAARAGDSDVTREAYAIRVKECGQRVPSGLWVHGCGGFGGAAPKIAARTAAPNPSFMPFPAMLRAVLRPLVQ